MRSRSKYKNTKTVIDGISFDSRQEGQFYELLKRMKAEEEIQNFELQPRFELMPKFKYFGETKRKTEYVADFLIYHLDGTEEIIDIKGMATETALLKRKMMQYKYPGLKLTWLCRSIKWGCADGWIDYDELKKRRRRK